MLRELVDLGLWNEEMKNMLIANNGSIQSINGIPEDVKAIYKTVWEISQKKVLELAADRGAFICQSQSLNVHLQSPTVNQLTSMHFYGWKKGLKTGMYYLRTRPAAQAIQFTVDQATLKEAQRLRTVRAAGGIAKAKASPLPTPASSTPSSLPTPTSTPSTPVREASSIALAPPAAAEPSGAVAAAPEPEIDYAEVVAKMSPEVLEASLAALSLNDETRAAALKNPEYAAALFRKNARELEEAKLMCSLENKEACVMCSG